MKLSTGYILALASVGDAQPDKENDHMVIISGDDERNVYGEHCIAEQNQDGILTITTTKGRVSTQKLLNSK